MAAAPKDRPAVRIGTAERETAASALGDHFAAGRLTRDELDERLERAMAARTHEDLAPLFADLPTGSAVVPAPSAAVAERGPVRPPRAVLTLVVLLAVVVWVATTHVPPFFLVPLFWFGLARSSHRRRRAHPW